MLLKNNITYVCCYGFDSFSAMEEYSFSTTPYYKEGTSASLRCPFTDPIGASQTNWSIYNSDKHVATQMIFSSNMKQNEANKRYSLSGHQLRIKNVTITDEGYYQGKFLDKTTGVSQDCVIELKVYGM